MQDPQINITYEKTVVGPQSFICGLEWLPKSHLFRECMHILHITIIYTLFQEVLFML